MVFSSLTFLLIFLPALILIYFSIPSKYRAARNLILLLFSLVFYAWGEPVYVFTIIICVILTYIVSGKIGQKKKWALIFSLLVNLLPLLIYKYADFFISNINQLPGIRLKLLNLPLPIGISFYTFHMLTYIIDLYRGKVNRQKNPFYLLLYVLLFPQLVAGPIVRYSTVELQITNRNENWSDFVSGLRRFIIGLSKKVLIANQVGFIANTIMNQDSSQIGSGLIWLAVLSYTIQIYFDFSGYSDMALGLARMFGFHLLENFNYPYISTSVTEFWRRWHISMSTFFRDYVYIPLGGSRVSPPRWLINIFVVWFLTGMWHGAYWNFIFWGLYYGLLLVIEKFLLKRFLERMPGILAWGYTFLMTLFGWAIFMTETNRLGHIASIFGKMLSFHSIATGATIRSLQLQSNIPFIFIGFILSFPILNKLRDIKILQSKPATLLIDLGIIAMLLTSGIYIVAGSFNPFIYFRF